MPMRSPLNVEVDARRATRQRSSGRPLHRYLTPQGSLIGVLSLFMTLAVHVSAATGAWEANDEPDHVANASTLLRGSMYRIEPGAGFEPHQPPLY